MSAAKAYRLLQALSIGLSIWGMFPGLMRHYTLLTSLLAIFPWIVMGAILIYPEIPFNVIGRGKLASKQWITVLLLPIFIGDLRAIQDFYLVDAWEILPPTFLIALGTGLAFVNIFTDLPRPIDFRTNVLLVAVLYGASMSVIANCRLDRSPPEVFESAVTRKYTTKGNKSGTHYHLLMAPWGPVTERGDVSVPSTFYKGINEGEILKIEMRQGFFGIKWYTIEY